MHPRIVERVIFPVHEWLKGKPTYRFAADLERSQWLGRNGIRDRQFDRLKGFLQYVYREVSYYRKQWDACGFHPERLNTLEEFSTLPTLTREDLRACIEELRPRRGVKRVQKLSTGGSTGNPVTVLVDAERAAFTDAARMRAHRWFDVKVGAPEIVLWGSPLELTKQDYVRALRDRLVNSTLLSAFDMSEAKLAEYVEELGRRRPEKLYGYASALHLLACWILNHGPKLAFAPKVVFTTAEPLFEFQRRAIQEAFQCPVSVEYGARDAGLIANECPAGGLHIPAEGMIVEIDSLESGAPGEIIVTNLYSMAMPIIRYRTGDVGALDDSPCACGRGLPKLKQVEGRQTDFLVAPDGRVLHALSVIYVLREVPGIREFRVLQESADRLRVLVAPEAELSEAQRSSIATGLGKLLGPTVDIRIEPLPQLPRSPSGKFRYVISEVAQKHLAGLGMAQPSTVELDVDVRTKRGK